MPAQGAFREEDVGDTYLCNCVVALDNWQDALLLNGGGFGESIAVDSSQNFLLQSHMIKLIN